MSVPVTVTALADPSGPRRPRRRSGCALLVLGALALLALAIHLVVLGMQEDVDLGPRSPYRWLLIDADARALEVPGTIRVDGYYYTVGDGPKLPASEKLVVSRASPAAITAAIDEQLAARGFEGHDDRWYERVWIGEDDERIVLELTRRGDDATTLVRIICYR